MARRKEHEAALAVTMDAVQILHDCCSWDVQLRHQVVLAGGVKFLLALLVNLSDHSELVEACCKTLQAICILKPPFFPPPPPSSSFDSAAASCLRSPSFPEGCKEVLKRNGLAVLSAMLQQDHGPLHTQPITRHVLSVYVHLCCADRGKLVVKNSACLPGLVAAFTACDPTQTDFDTKGASPAGPIALSTASSAICTALALASPTNLQRNDSLVEAGLVTALVGWLERNGKEGSLPHGQNAGSHRDVLGQAVQHSQRTDLSALLLLALLSQNLTSVLCKQFTQQGGVRVFLRRLHLINLERKVVYTAAQEAQEQAHQELSSPSQALQSSIMLLLQSRRSSSAAGTALLQITERKETAKRKFQMAARRVIQRIRAEKVLAYQAQAKAAEEEAKAAPPPEFAPLLKALAQLSSQFWVADRMVDLAATTVVMGCIETLEYRGPLVSFALVTLSNLAQNTYKASKAQMIKEGVTQGLAEMLTRAKEGQEADVCVAMDALGHLAFSEKAASRISSLHPLVYRIHSVLLSFSRFNAVLVTALVTLSKLSRTERNATSIVRLLSPLLTEALDKRSDDKKKCGALIPVVEKEKEATVAMATEEETYELLKASLVLLQNLYTHKSCVEKGTSFIPAMLRAIQTFLPTMDAGKHEDQQQQDVPKDNSKTNLTLLALHALCNVAAWKNQAMRGTLRHNGAVQMCELVLSVHGTSKKNPLSAAASQLLTFLLNKDGADVTKAMQAGDDMRNLLMGGTMVSHYNDFGVPIRKKIYVTSDFMKLFLKPMDAKAKLDDSIPINGILEVSAGRNSSTFHRLGKLLSEGTLLCIRCKNISAKNVILSLQFNTEKEVTDWKKALETCISYAKGQKAISSGFGSR
eukprot:gb/GEZN01001645.1/.p1 GENE.gb/GEZN01001645.1/~~gb/GEZN01001645.1/.p1  ORF type:complete len:951 (-),score=185.40 gb/GEZN01001645.1/:50-2647(-)